MSETERDERLKSSKRKGAPKKKGPSKDFRSEEARDRGKDAPGEKQGKEEKAPKRKSLYPVKELEALGLDSSETDELSPSEEEDLEDEAARYEEERYGPRWRATMKKPKVMNPLWARLVILFIFFFVWEAITAVRTGQRVLTEQQESMSEGEKVSKEKTKRKGDKRNTVLWEKNFVFVLVKGVIRLYKLCRVILIRLDRGRPPENLFRRIKQKDISMPMHSLMELM